MCNKHTGDVIIVQLLLLEAQLYLCKLLIQVISQMSTHVFALFCVGPISHQQNKGKEKIFGGLISIFSIVHYNGVHPSGKTVHVP